jgi:hypothetical protein
MFKTIIIVVALGVLAYVLRRNFRRAWYIFRTGAENPDWEKLGGDYFLASWEKSGSKGFCCEGGSGRAEIARVEAFPRHSR